MPLVKPTVGQPAWGATMNTALDYLDTTPAAALTAHEADTTSVHGIANTADVVLRTLADAKGDLLVATAADVLARRAVGTNGQVLTADSAESTGVKWAAGGGGPTVVYKSVNETVTSSASVQNDDHLFFAMAATETWAFEVVLFVGGATAGDIQIGFTAPSLAIGRWGVHGIAEAVTTEIGDFVATSLAAFGGTSSSVISGTNATVVTTVILRGLVANQGNAGNLQLQWAQGSTSGTATTVYQYSHLIATKQA